MFLHPLQWEGSRERLAFDEFPKFGLPQQSPMCCVPFEGEENFIKRFGCCLGGLMFLRDWQIFCPSKPLMPLVNGRCQPNS